MATGWTSTASLVDFYTNKTPVTSTATLVDLYTDSCEHLQAPLGDFYCILMCSSGLLSNSSGFLQYLCCPQVDFYGDLSGLSRHFMCTSTSTLVDIHANSGGCLRHHWWTSTATHVDFCGIPSRLLQDL
uniref:Uncharacterized protein n=1 Tax=Ditylenchus dipsaci TaxID=166011 RepID=A0A915DJX6_9BILA